jgi:threonine/homoserine/homoserine lactone efflux protein
MDITALALFAFVTSIAPGPNTVMLWGSGMNFGLRRTIPHLLGVNLGFGSLMFAVSVGLGAVFEQFSVIGEVLKVLGSLYLIYLAYRVATSADGGEVADAAKPLNFWEAMAFQYVNPKAWVMAVSAVGAFLPSGQSVVLASATLTGVFVVIHAPSVTVWVTAGTAIGRVLTNDRRRRVVNTFLAALLVATVFLLWA